VCYCAAPLWIVSSTSPERKTSAFFCIAVVKAETYFSKHDESSTLSDLGSVREITFCGQRYAREFHHAPGLAVTVTPDILLREPLLTDRIFGQHRGE
jgi:hypothetical protein